MDVALSPRQEMFVAEYLVDSNATRAYKAAGYSGQGNAAEACASRMLRNAKVREKIKEKMAELAERVELTQEWVIERLRENAARAMQAEAARDADGNIVGDFSYQGAVANRSYELIGKHIGMWPDKREISGPNGGPIKMAAVNQMADDEVEREIAATRAALAALGTADGEAAEDGGEE